MSIDSTTHVHFRFFYVNLFIVTINYESIIKLLYIFLVSSKKIIVIFQLVELAISANRFNFIVKLDVGRTKCNIFCGKLFAKWNES